MDSILNENMNYAIVTGTGRCGTQFLSKLLSLSHNVVSRHDPNPLNLSFHRYAKWYNLPIDDAAFFSAKEKEIKEDLDQASISIHSSAHMAFSVEDLYRRFNCKVVVLYRHPANVVNSYMGKGLYKEHYVLGDAAQALGFQNVGTAPHHFFSRTVPRDSFFETWNNLTRVGKIAWMWSAVNKEILRQLASVPSEKVFVSKLEDFDYKKYLELAGFLGITPVVENTFAALRKSKPNTLRTSDQYTVRNWSEAERGDFLQQVEPLAGTLGYALDLEQIIQKEKATQSVKKSGTKSKGGLLKKLVRLFQG